ncbi:MAG: PspA/IM30 family protein [Planctomycetaceae bacterium]
MQWLNQFTFVMKSSLTALREKIEDPERMLQQLIIDMEEEQESVRRSVAEAIADEIQLGKQVDREREAGKDWFERATKALKRGDETTSKAALEQKMLAEKRADDLNTQYEKQKTQTRKLQDSVRDLEDKLRQARQKRTLLLARLARSNSSRRINAALDQASSSSAFAHFNRLEQRVDRAEALEEAYDRMEGRDPEADELERQFDEAERRENVSSEFERLKQQLAQST